MSSSNDPAKVSDRRQDVSSWQPEDFTAEFSTGRLADNAAPVDGHPGEFDGSRQPSSGTWPSAGFTPLDINSLSISEPQGLHVQDTRTTTDIWMPPEFDPTLLAMHGKNQGLGTARPALLAEDLEKAQRAMQESQEKAAEIIHQAEAQASQITEQAEIQAGEITQQALTQATEVTRQALSEGVAAANAETKELLRTATAIVGEVNAWRENLFTQGEMMMLRLVIEIAQTIFGDGLPLDPEILGQTFSRALPEAKTLGDLRIHVHPDDAAVLSPHWPQEQSDLRGQLIELVHSDIIKRGGCFVEGEFGSIDARVETHFKTIEETLLSNLSTPKGEQE